LITGGDILTLSALVGVETRKRQGIIKKSVKGYQALLTPLKKIIIIIHCTMITDDLISVDYIHLTKFLSFLYV